MNDDKILCFDLDGVIASLNSDYSKCTPIKGAIHTLSQLKESGFTIIIHTGRHILNMDVTLDWLKKYKVPYDHIQFGKPVARVYVDDRAIQFKSWEDLINSLDFGTSNLEKLREVKKTFEIRYTQRGWRVRGLHFSGSANNDLVAKKTHGEAIEMAKLFNWDIIRVYERDGLNYHEVYR